MFHCKNVEENMRKESCEYHQNSLDEQSVDEDALVQRCPVLTLSNCQQSKNSLVHNKGHINFKAKSCTLNISKFASTHEIVENHVQSNRMIYISNNHANFFISDLDTVIAKSKTPKVSVSGDEEGNQNSVSNAINIFGRSEANENLTPTRKRRETKKTAMFGCNNPKNTRKKGRSKPKSKGRRSFYKKTKKRNYSKIDQIN